MCAHHYMSLLLDGEFWIKCQKFCLFQLFAQKSSAILNDWLASFLADNHHVSKRLLFYRYSLLKENIFKGSIWSSPRAGKQLDSWPQEGSVSTIYVHIQKIIPGSIYFISTIFASYCAEILAWQLNYFSSTEANVNSGSVNRHS